MEKALCGFAQRDITPVPSEVFLDGYGHRVTPATGVRDELYVKVCVCKSDQSIFVIAAYDVCGFCFELKTRLREFIKHAVGLGDAQLAICATHTHAAPACGVLGDLPINYLYWNTVAQKTVSAIREAIDRLCVCDIRISFGNELTTSYNRRGQDRIDRRVRAAGFFNANGNLIGVIASANCHAVSQAEYLISADYPGVLTAKAAAEYPGVPFLFLQGRGADINPDSFEIGDEVADSVFFALSRMKPTEKNEDTAVRSAYQAVSVPMKYPAPEQLEIALAEYLTELEQDSPANDKRYAFIEANWHMKAIAESKKGIEPALTADLVVTFVGKALAFVFIPFELLTSTGNTVEELLVNAGFSRESIFVIGYSNGTFGYLAPQNEFAIGGYEISGAAHWYLLPECTDMSEKAVLDGVRSLIDTQTHK